MRGFGMKFDVVFIACSSTLVREHFFCILPQLHTIRATQRQQIPFIPFYELFVTFVNLPARRQLGSVDCEKMEGAARRAGQAVTVPRQERFRESVTRYCTNPGGA